MRIPFAQIIQIIYMLQAEAIIQNRYQLKQKLGDNTARQTWLATDLELPENPQVVVKLLAFGGQIQWENLKLFEREAQVLKQLNHPHIPKYRDYFCIDDRSLWFALVEDYIPGASLKELLAQKQKFTEKQVRKIARDILNILAYLHQLNPRVLHRDIKPSNLILGEDEQIYLVDFGAVQDTAAKEGGTFTVVGTYGYTPIEQFGGRAVPASDLYALGATLIHLLTGIAPADLPQKDFRIHFKGKVNISSGFVRWLEKLTEPVLEKRLATVEQANITLENSRGYIQNNSPLTVDLLNRTPPSHSKRIELSKHFDKLKINIKPRLQIQIPSNIQKLANQFLNIWCIAGISFVFLALIKLPFTLLTLLPILFFLTWIHYYFTTTNINFEFDRFEIKRQLFGITYLSNKGITLQIQDVSLQSTSNGDRGITLTLGSSFNRFTRFSFGSTLSEAELIWLAQEIREWLQLQKQRELRH